MPCLYNNLGPCIAVIPKACVCQQMPRYLYEEDLAMFDRATNHIHSYAYPAYNDLTACRIEIEDCIARLARIENLLMTTTAQVKEALTAVTTDVADETNALNAFDTTLANIAAKLDSLVQQVANNGNVPQEIADQIAALQLAISQNRDHIVNITAKGTELAGKATADPGPNTEVLPALSPQT